MIPIIAVSFVVLLLLGIPVAFVIGVAGFIGLWWSGEYPLTVIVKQIFEGVDSFVLLAIPLFILACLLYTSPSPRDRTRSRMPSSA